MNTVGLIMNIFENHLNANNIELENKERDKMKEIDPFEYYSNIYGADYEALEKEIVKILE